MSEKPETKENSAINRSFVKLCHALDKFEYVCVKNGAPIRRVTYNVEDETADSETNVHVTYRRVKK